MQFYFLYTKDDENFLFLNNIPYTNEKYEFLEIFILLFI